MGRLRQEGSVEGIGPYIVQDAEPMLTSWRVNGPRIAMKLNP